jgi:thioredoxin 1
MLYFRLVFKKVFWGRGPARGHNSIVVPRSLAFGKPRRTDARRELSDTPVTGAIWVRTSGDRVESTRIVVLSEDNFDDEIKQREGPIVVDFWASWCRLCKGIAPVLGQIAEEMNGRAHIATVNVEDHGDLANRFGIRSVPTLVVFRDGKVVDQMIGAAPKDLIVGLIRRHLN